MICTSRGLEPQGWYGKTHLLLLANIGPLSIFTIYQTAKEELSHLWQKSQNCCLTSLRNGTKLTKLHQLCLKAWLSQTGLHRMKKSQKLPKYMETQKSEGATFHSLRIKECFHMDLNLITKGFLQKLTKPNHFTESQVSYRRLINLTRTLLWNLKRF